MFLQVPRAKPAAILLDVFLRDADLVSFEALVVLVTNLEESCQCKRQLTVRRQHERSAV